MYVCFIPEFWALDNHLVCSSLVKYHISCYQLASVAKVIFVGLSTHLVFSLQFGMPIGSCLSSIDVYSHVGESCPCLYLLALLETNLTTNSLIIYFLHSSCLLFNNVSWSIGVGAFCKCIHGELAPQLSILIVSRLL